MERFAEEYKTSKRTRGERGGRKGEVDRITGQIRGDRNKSNWEVNAQYKYMPYC